MQSSLAEPWLPTGMLRELNTPAPAPEILNTSPSSIPDLDAQSAVPDLEAPSTKLRAPTNSKEATASKFKFKKLKKKVDNSESEKLKQDDAPQESLVETLLAPKVQTEYVGRPVVTIVIIVTFPLDFVSTTKNTYMCYSLIYFSYCSLHIPPSLPPSNLLLYIA